MNSILKEIVLYPAPLFYGLLGVMGGAVGAGLAAIVSRIWPAAKEFSRALTIAFVFLATQLPRPLLPQLEREARLDTLFEDVTLNRVFRLLFNAHPEAEIELRDAINTIAPQSGYYEYRDARLMASLVVEKYVRMHLLSSSDDAIHRLLNHRWGTLRKLRDQPDHCVAYAAGVLDFEALEGGSVIIVAEFGVDAGVIESSINNPTTPPRNDPAEAARLLMASASRNNSNIDNLSKLDQIQFLPPSQGCQVAIDVAAALAMMPVEDAAFVFKNLQY